MLKLVLLPVNVALSYSESSDSILTAANQISSELGFAWKASDKIPLATETSFWKKKKIIFFNKLIFTKKIAELIFKFYLHRKQYLFTDKL